IFPEDALPFLRERVLGEDRLDGTLRLAGAAIAGINAACQRERVLARHYRAEGVGVVPVPLLDAHDSPEDLAPGQVEPTNRSAVNAEVRLDARLFARADGDEAGVGRHRLEPGERPVIGRPQTPGSCLDRVAVRGEPAVDEACDVLDVRSFGKQAL